MSASAEDKQTDRHGLYAQCTKAEILSIVYIKLCDKQPCMYVVLIARSPTQVKVKVQSALLWRAARYVHMNRHKETVQDTTRDMQS